MNEKIYGIRKSIYGVVERPDGWIELRVYHTNKSMRRLLRQHAAKPRAFLGRRAAFARSNIRAQRWLADAIDAMDEKEFDMADAIPVVGRGFNECRVWVQNFDFDEDPNGIDYFDGGPNEDDCYIEILYRFEQQPREGDTFFFSGYLWELEYECDDGEWQAKKIG